VKIAPGPLPFNPALVSGKNLIKEKNFQHQLCLFSPGDGYLQKNDIM